MRQTYVYGIEKGKATQSPLEEALRSNQILQQQVEQLQQKVTQLEQEATLSGPAAVVAPFGHGVLSWPRHRGSPRELFP